jgi:hypothetical protein
MITQVQFKKFEDGEVIALFPNEEWDLKGNIASYIHLGQHGGASKELLDDLDPATKEEYQELKNELEGIGYQFEVL